MTKGLLLESIGTQLLTEMIMTFVASGFGLLRKSCIFAYQAALNA